MSETNATLDPNDPATRAAAFATTVRPISDGVCPEHIIAVVSYLARDQVVTPTLAAQIGQACRLLFAAAAELVRGAIEQERIARGLRPLTDGQREAMEGPLSRMGIAEFAMTGASLETIELEHGPLPTDLFHAWRELEKAATSFEAALKKHGVRS